MREIAAGKRAATDAEIQSMASEIVALRSERTDDGTVLVHLAHASDKSVSGWFEPQNRRVAKTELHPRGRITLSGRTYHIVTVDDAQDPPVVRVK